MKRVFLSTVLASSLMFFAGCGDDVKQKVTDNVNTIKEDVSSIASSIMSQSSSSAQSDAIPFGDGSFSPFERIAIFSVSKDSSGAIDYNATEKKVSQIATSIAKYIAETNESAVLGSDKFRGGDWIVAGVEGEISDEKIAHSILGIPTSKLINPNEPASTANSRKVKLVEICNKTYASKALGVLDVAEGEKVANGKIHGTALPCEIAIYSDDTNIYVEMLNPEAIFTLFFTDVLFGTQMSSEKFKNAMLELPTQVKNEIKDVVYASLQTETFEKTATKVGPIFTTMSEILKTVESSPNQSPYIHYKYQKTGGEKFSDTEAKAIAIKLIDVMTRHTDTTAGVHEVELETQLSANSSWRSARETPLSVPGNVSVVEACSPLYAKKAMDTGLVHATALPCEISFYVDSNGDLMVTFLDPNFMFGAMFSDALSKMSQTELDSFKTLPEAVFKDLKTIVDYTFTKNYPNISSSTEVKFNMLGAK